MKKYILVGLIIGFSLVQTCDKKTNDDSIGYSSESTGYTADCDNDCSTCTSDCNLK